MSATYLDTILEATRDRLAAEKRRRSMADYDRDAYHMPKSRDFVGALSAPGMSVIAEFKRRSPSKGLIREDMEPNQAAEWYEQGGARAMSVLTEPQFFSGSLDDLHRARAAIGLPVLRKDFVIDPYQVAQSRAEHADAILLIVAALEDLGLFKELMAAAADYGLAVLVEAHDEQEVDTALSLKPSLLGINQRNLRNFEVDTGLAARLRTKVTPGVAVVCESGISDRQQVQALEEAQVDAILVGETLMRAADPSQAIRTLLGPQVD